MTEEERIVFIKNRIAPLFDGMNAKDIYDILRDAGAFPDLVLSRFIVCQDQKSKT